MKVVMLMSGDRSSLSRHITYVQVRHWEYCGNLPARPPACQRFLNFITGATKTNTSCLRWNEISFFLNASRTEHKGDMSPHAPHRSRSFGVMCARCRIPARPGYKYHVVAYIQPRYLEPLLWFKQCWCDLVENDHELCPKCLGVGRLREAEYATLSERGKADDLSTLIYKSYGWDDRGCRKLNIATWKVKKVRNQSVEKLCSGQSGDQTIKLANNEPEMLLKPELSRQSSWTKLWLCTSDLLLKSYL